MQLFVLLCRVLLKVLREQRGNLGPALLFQARFEPRQLAARGPEQRRDKQPIHEPHHVGWSFRLRHPQVVLPASHPIVKPDVLSRPCAVRSGGPEEENQQEEGIA